MLWVWHYQIGQRGERSQIWEQILVTCFKLSAGCLVLKSLEEEVFASVIFNHCSICSNSSCNLSSIRDREILIYLLLLYLKCIIFFFTRGLWQLKVGMNILSIYSSAKALRFISDIVLLEFWKIFRIELPNTLKPLCFLINVGQYDKQEKLMSETLHSSCKKNNAGGIQCSETLFCHAGMRISSMPAAWGRNFWSLKRHWDQTPSHCNI